MSGARELGLERLDDYVSGQLGDDDAARLEEALFDAAAAGAAPELAFVDQLARFAAHLAARGTYDGMTRAEVDRALASGRRIHYQDVGPAGRVTVAIPDDVDLVIFAGHADLRGVDRIDCEIEVPALGQRKTIQDVRFDPGGDELFAVCEPALARTAFAHGELIWRAFGYRGGRREELGTWISSAPA